MAIAFSGLLLSDVPANNQIGFVMAFGVLMDSHFSCCCFLAVGGGWGKGALWGAYVLFIFWGGARVGEGGTLGCLWTPFFFGGGKVGLGQGGHCLKLADLFFLVLSLGFRRKGAKNNHPLKIGGTRRRSVLAVLSASSKDMSHFSHDWRQWRVASGTTSAGLSLRLSSVGATAAANSRVAQHYMYIHIEDCMYIYIYTHTHRCPSQKRKPRSFIRMTQHTGNFCIESCKRTWAHCIFSMSAVNIKLNTHAYFRAPNACFCGL